MNRSKTGKLSHMGRPRIYPDTIEEALKLIKRDKDFTGNWTIEDTKRNSVVHGECLLKVGWGKKKPIPFTILVPKFCDNPLSKVVFKFKHTNVVRNALEFHDFRAHLEGLYYEDLNPETQETLKTKN